ncbi:MAG: electron transfer flavoprotein subunit beta/FixA family protein [Deltaproteobacteria bacterium]|jgi:electron transfer flavoprotein beta subunit|nr:electron transfer flavoprotein subunit beta/FixA family protein [Deltaproteobacteria bacterium]
MKIYVCVKHVPDTAARISLKDDTSYEDAVAIKFVVNPYDEYGLEEAVELAKAKDGEVIIVTIGKEAAVASIRAGLAMGAHRGIHVQTDQQFLDSEIVSQALKKAIDQDGKADLIFTGKQSVDSEGLQTQYRLAAEMNMAVLNGVVALSIDGDKAIVEREIGEGSREVLEMDLPCVIGATKGLNTPRYPKLPDIMKAKKKEIKKIDLSELGIDLSGSQLLLKKLEEAPSRSAAKMLSGTVPEMASEFLRIMKEEEKVL